MTEEKKIKVAWVCHFSNEYIRKQLHFKKDIVGLIKKRQMIDFAQWNINAINEFKKFNDVELHVISPHIQMSSNVQEFTKDGIHYHFFRSEDDNFLFRLKRKFLKGKYLTPDYKRNSEVILSFINSIKPDLIHVIGAENAHYSISALSMPNDIPLIVALQTLMIAPDFLKNYPISKNVYEYRSGIERKVLERADYISIRGKRFIDILNEEIKPTPKILEMPLAVGEELAIADYEKHYDFIYYAVDISKAADYALEAFAIAKKKHKDITLHVVGGYSDAYMNMLKARMQELGIDDGIDFTGRLATRDDVINEVRKARFALLPLKVDLIAGTIRECMANGLPVVTTITPATPRLNDKRESILLSEKADFQAMADNMCRLLEEDGLADTLRQNAAIEIHERYSNETAMKQWKENYYNVIKEWKGIKE